MFLNRHTLRHMIEVKIKQDDDGHDYVIPAELSGEFDDLLFNANVDGDYNVFISRFSGYMRNPDELKLYTDEI